MQVSLTISLNAQSISEYVKTNQYTYNCAYCKKIKKEDKLDIASIKNPEIANNASTYAMASAMFGSAFSSGSDICDIGRTGRHRYEQISKTVTKELYTAKKEKTNNSSSFDMDAFNKVISAGSSGDGNKKENTNNSSSFDLAASNKATQVWMTSNLDVNKFRNGDPIPEAKSAEEWEKAGTDGKPAWCYYENDLANSAKYGKLYNWYALNDARGLAPEGYHVPTDDEWTVLTDYLGGDTVAGTKMKSTSGWSENGNGRNESGFSGLPGGVRENEGSFLGIGYGAVWWSASEDSTNDAYYRYLILTDDNLFRHYYFKGKGLSVRCLRD